MRRGAAGRFKPRLLATAARADEEAADTGHADAREVALRMSRLLEADKSTLLYGRSKPPGESVRTSGRSLKVNTSWHKSWKNLSKSQSHVKQPNLV